MYAIVFDLDTQKLESLYGSSYNNAYVEIRRMLESLGFKWQQGSIYFGDSHKVDAVSCVLAAQKLSRSFVWFEASVRDIRMLRIEDNNDLNTAIARKDLLGSI